MQLKRSRPEGAELDEEEQAEVGEVVDAQLERAVDVLKGIMIFEANAEADRRLARR